MDGRPRGFAPTCFEHLRDHAVQGRGIADDLDFKFQPLPFRHDRHAVIAHRPADQNHITRAGVFRGDVDSIGNDAKARCVDENPVAVTFVDDLRMGKSMHWAKER